MSCSRPSGSSASSVSFLGPSMFCSSSSQSKAMLVCHPVALVPALTHWRPQMQPDPAVEQLALHPTRTVSARFSAAMPLLTCASPEPPWFLRKKFQKALVSSNLIKDFLTFGSDTHAYPLNLIHHGREIRSPSLGTSGEAALRWSAVPLPELSVAQPED